MDSLRTRTSEIGIDEAGILHINLLKRSELDVDDAIDVFLLAKKISHGNPSLVMVDTRLKGKITPAAWKLITKKNVPARYIAKAVVVSSQLEKQLHNFFTRFKGSKFPVRKFTSEDEALLWLKTYN